MTDLIEVKTADLVGPALDWAVAKADGMETIMLSPRKGDPKKPFALFGSLALAVGGEDQSGYTPSGCWHCGGPMIYKHILELKFYAHEHPDASWRAETREGWGEGPSVLLAACRAIVAAKLGKTVQVPKELMPEGELR